MSAKHRTQNLCYEVLDCLKQLSVSPAHVDAPADLWEALAERVIELEGEGSDAFQAELKSVERVLMSAQRRHRWDRNKYIAARISVYKAYCQLLSQAYDKFDEPTSIARKANHMAEKHSYLNVGVAQSYELRKLRNQIRKNPNND